ncbi:MAG TPA: DNA recombination protein RmuC [Burkholderiales bacterium]|nr:DNA recombination protein RmuC [Burkholderiales bacterium]
MIRRSACVYLIGTPALTSPEAGSWRQEALAENAQEVADLGKQLYERVAKLGEHLANVGDKLGKAVDAYNSATSTLESRVLVSARRLRELKAAPEGVESEVIEPVQRTARAVQAPELSSMPSNGDKQ